MELHRFKLIGIFGKDDARHAMIRLSSSKYRIVDVGFIVDSRFEVIEILEDRIRLVDARNGEYFVVHMPR